MNGEVKNPYFNPDIYEKALRKVLPELGDTLEVPIKPSNEMLATAVISGAKDKHIARWIYTAMLYTHALEKKENENTRKR